jgi:tetratricopeptide (TPR) repeat protein
VKLLPRSLAASTSLAVALALAAPAPARAFFSAPAAAPAGESVDELNAQAIEKFRAKQYDEAVELFERAYAASPEPNYLFNIGRVYEEKGDIEKAVEYYERFVREPGVELAAREAAVERLKILREIVKKEQPTVAEPKTDPALQAKPEDEQKPKPSGMAIAGYVLIGVGVVGVGIGGGLGGIALGRSKDLDSQTGYDARHETATSGKKLAIGADVGLFVGGAMVVTGVVLAVIAARRAKKQSGGRTAFAPTFGASGGGVAVLHRF